ncbi:hypothetical protein RFI_36195, partial [Reticulomyxa filosa]
KKKKKKKKRRYQKGYEQTRDEKEQQIEPDKMNVLQSSANDTNPSFAQTNVMDLDGMQAQPATTTTTTNPNSAQSNAITSTEILGYTGASRREEERLYKKKTSKTIHTHTHTQNDNNFFFFIKKKRNVKSSNATDKRTVGKITDERPPKKRSSDSN